MSLRRHGASLLALFALSIGLSCLAPASAMMIKREIKDPAFDFTLSEPEKCHFSPDPHRVEGALYYLVECGASVSQVKITFGGNPKSKQVYDIDFNEIPSFTAYPEAGKLSTYFLHTCDNPSDTTKCLTYQMDVSRSDGQVPQLARGGITFSNYAELPKFDPTSNIYDVKLYAKEPTTIAIRAPYGFLVDFDQGFAEKGFIEHSATKVFVPQGQEGETESFSVFVTNPDRSKTTTYTVNVHTVKSINPRLASVDVYPGRLDPVFAPHRYSYFYRVPEGTSKVTLTMKGVNERDTKCFVQPLGLGGEQPVTGRSLPGIDISNTYKFWQQTDGSTPPPPAARNFPEPIPIGGGGSVTMKLPKVLHSTNIVVDCVAADDTYKVRYVYSVVPQVGGSTLLQGLEVVNHPFDRSFDPILSGPYGVNMAAAEADTDGAKWVNFRVTPTNPRAVCEVEGTRVDSNTHLSSYFRIMLGEKRRFRVSVRTPENAVEEEYFVVISRPAPWYKSARFGSKIAEWVGITSSAISATRGVNFINNAKFLQFISLSNRLNGNPETYESYSHGLNKYNLQFDVPESVYIADNMKNRTFYAPPTGYSEILKQFQIDGKTKIPVAAIAVSRESEWQHALKAAVGQYRMYEAPIQSISSDVEESSKWTAVHTDAAMFENVVERTLTDFLHAKVEAAERDGTLSALHAQSPARLLLPTTAESQREIVMRLDAEYKKEQKLLNYCSSIFITTIAMLVIGSVYAFIWSLYLRDVREGWTVLRQDFPAILKPTRFWTFLFDYALISYLQSCCGILFSSGNRHTTIRLFGIVTSASKMAWFAGFMLVAFPVVFIAIGILILFRIRQDLVFSKTFQRHHDSRAEELKAHQKFFSWIPILSNLCTVEITSVAPVSRFPTEQRGASDGPINFTEETKTDAPSMCGNPDEVNKGSTDPMDVEGGQRAVGYESLLGGEQRRIQYREETDTVKVTVPQDSYESRLDTINPALYNRFPEALVGFSKYKMKNAYDHMINIQAQVQLRHLTSLMSLQSYSLWVPRENLRQDQVDDWNLLFGKSQKGNMFYWIMDRCVTAAIIVFLTSWTDKSGIAHGLVFAFVCLLVALVYVPSAMATAVSKWYRLMEREVESKKHETHFEQLEDNKYKVWPFRRPGVKEQFEAIREHKRDFEMFGTFKLWRQFVAQPYEKFENLEFWKTRCWLTIRECIVGPICSDVMKFLTLFTVFMGNHSIGLYSNTFASFTSMCLTIVALFCLNTEGIKDWMSQMYVMWKHVCLYTRRTLVKICDWVSEPRLIGRKFTHFMASCQRLLQGEKGVCFGYPGFAGEKVRDYKVDEVVIVNNEIGVHLPGKIEHSSKTKNEMKFSNCMEKGRFGIHKTLHVNGSLGVHRCMLDRAMPVQMPFKQFFFLGNGNEECNVMQRLAATVQIVNYNESRAASGHSHSADDDSFLSLYTNPALMSEYGKVRMRHQGHGYIVRWLPDKQMILIRGPAIKGDVEYSIDSVIEKPPKDEDDLASTPSSASTAELLGDRKGVASTEAVCKSSGLLVVQIPSGNVPDTNRVVQCSRHLGESFEIDPAEVKIEYHQYQIGRSQRRELILRSRKLTAGSTPYSVSWHVKSKGKKINATAKSVADGVLFVPWTEEASPDLHSYISLRYESEGSKLTGSVIDIDPRDTDAHQFILPPVKYNGMARIVAAVSSGASRFVNSIVGRNPAREILDEPIPCTVVQCTNPLERQYRVEPNFAEAVRDLRGRIEQLTGLKKDLELPERLGYLWSEFMSTNEFINFWESIGVSIVIRGAWINPITNSNHMYMRENQQRVQDGQMKFRVEIARRIEARISVLTVLLDRYKHWNKAYNDNDLYACQIAREASEWGTPETGTLDVQVRQLQQLKMDYEASLTDFQYPMTVDDRLICRREKFDAQLRVWREELTAWLFQCEGASLLAEQGGKSCAQAIIDDTMRAVEHSMRKTEHAQSGIYRTVLHYVVSSVAVRGRETNWKPDPLAAHFCMVRLFPGDVDDVNKVDWERESWTPCFLKLAGDKVVMMFPHEVDAKAPTPEYYEDELTRRWGWNQMQANYIPLECFEKMFLSIDPSIASDPSVSADVRRMHAKLVLKKNTEIHVDDRYVKSLFTGDFWDELLYDENQVFKIRLGNTVSNKDQAQFKEDDKFFHGDRCTVLPLTFRFHHSHFNKWQSAIRMAQMNNPRKEMTDFNGHIEGDGYTTSEESSHGGHVPAPLPPISSESDSQSSYSSSDVSSEISRSKSAESISIPSVVSSESVAPPPPPVVDASAYKGQFRDYRFSGKNGKLYDNAGKLVYDGDWVEGQRWGHGRCIFKDPKGTEWEFDGDFIADEMQRGKLNMVDDAELNRLRHSADSKDRYKIVAYDGTFTLPQAVRGSLKGETKKRDYTRMGSNCGLRGRPQISPEFLNKLFDSNTPVDADDMRDKHLVIDIRRAISMCADDETAKATTAWIQDNYGKQKATNFGRQDSAGSVDSEITINASNAFEEYLPHRSRWTRLIDPTAGYQSIIDRFSDGEVIFADGSRYKGEMQSGMPHGRGVLSCPKCVLVYNGYWRKGKPHGYGILSVGEQGAPERLEYYGNFKEGKRSGRGVQLAKDGKVVIKGEFDDDVLSGKSCSIDLADDVLGQFAQTYKRYIGAVEAGLPAGKGKLEWGDGATFKGEFLNGQRHGQGNMKDKNGRTIVSGAWEQDYPEGRMMALVLPDGKVYTGDVKRGQRQGMGELYSRGVANYEGLWMNDLPTGRGTLYSVDGDYEGEMFAGKRHGKGRFEFKTHPLGNGKPRVYEGDWKNDKPDGTGKYLNELGIENIYKFKDGDLLPSSTKAYKSSMCGKAPTMGIKFHVEPAPVTGHDPKYWGLKRHVDVEKVRALHRLGCGEWERHEGKPFVFTEAINSPRFLGGSEDLPRAPVKQKSLDSLATSSDPKGDEVIEIRVIEGVELPNMDVGKKMDPYCKVRIGRHMKRTKPINGGGSNPKWNAALNFPRSGAEWIEFEVWDKDTLTRDDFVGAGDYDLKQFLASGEKQHQAEIALTRTVKGQDAPAGSVKVIFSLGGNRFFSDNDSQSLSTLVTKKSADLAIGSSFCEIKVNSVAELYNTEMMGKMDPYLKFELGTNKMQTDYKKDGGQNCVMDYMLTMPYNNEPSLRFEVWDHDTITKDDLVGYGSVNLNTFTSGVVEIFRDDKKGGKVSAGKVNLAISIVKG